MNSFTASAGLAGHAGRLRWNTRYGERGLAAAAGSRAALSRLRRLTSCSPPGDPVLEPAGGVWEAALVLALGGPDAAVAGVSVTAPARLAHGAGRRRISGRPALLCRLFWGAALLHRACRWVAAGGLVDWEALADTGGGGPGRADRRLRAGRPGALLLEGFAVVHQGELGRHGRPARRMVARRKAPPSPRRC